MEAKTLVELFDERPLENVLGVEIFRPEKVIYICPEGTPEHAEKQLADYFAHRGVRTETEFLRVNVYDTQEILQVFRKVLQQYPESVMDITGGTDAVLFAAGLACAEAKIPVVTYSRTQNKFYNIQNAPSAHAFPCEITFSVEDCFLMAGGSMRKGRVDNSILSRYMDDIDPFFEVFLKYRRRWDKIVTYIQRVSAAREDGTYSLSVQGDYTVKGEQGARLTAPEGSPADSAGGSTPGSGKDQDDFRAEDHAGGERGVLFPGSAGPGLAAGRGQRAGTVYLQSLPGYRHVQRRTDQRGGGLERG